MKKNLIITIDGPAGAGKSTVSKQLARELGYTYLDTGALYRALAYQAIRAKININDQTQLADLCSRTKVTLANNNGKMKVYVNGEDVGDRIRTEEVSRTASAISTFPVVREALLQLQRDAGAAGGIVAEGRDMGSVVFPQADCKFYLDANVEERARRRKDELSGRGVAVEYQEIQKGMVERDKQDSEREIAPLKAADGAIIIDSTALTIEEVVESVMRQIKSAATANI
ncbi:MAG TPA: (d)CMP kinase [Smithellaceae bacterium]|nr:(d)CMP kinase [Smithellaceae bacterium]